MVEISTGDPWRWTIVKTYTEGICSERHINLCIKYMSSLVFGCKCKTNLNKGDLSLGTWCTKKMQYLWDELQSIYVSCVIFHGARLDTFWEGKVPDVTSANVTWFDLHIVFLLSQTGHSVNIYTTKVLVKLHKASKTSQSDGLPVYKNSHTHIHTLTCRLWPLTPSVDPWQQSEGQGEVTSCQNTSLHPNCCCRGDGGIRLAMTDELRHTVKAKTLYLCDRVTTCKILFIFKKVFHEYNLNISLFLNIFPLSTFPRGMTTFYSTSKFLSSSITTWMVKCMICLSIDHILHTGSWQ